MAGLLWEGRGFCLQCWALPGRLWGRPTSGHPLCGRTVPAGDKGEEGEQDLLEEAQLPRHHHEDTPGLGHETSWRPSSLAWVTWEAEGTKWSLKVTL